MFVNKLYVKNYRCFGETTALIEFSEPGLTALIGPNNVGKSTVLRMLEILLGDKWPRFEEGDFHNNELHKDIVLGCTFTKKIDVDIKGYKIPIAGVVVRARYIPTGYGESSIDVDYRLLESNANIENLDFERLDIASYRWKDGRRGDNPVYIGQEIKNQLPIVVTIPLIKLLAEQPTNKWSVLGRMLQKVENEFTRSETQKNAFEKKIKEAVKILRIDEFNEIERDVQTFWSKMKPANLTGTELKFLDYAPWRYYRQFKFSIKQGGKDVPLETLGEGVQRLAIIALYRAYLKKHGRNERAILLIEEPESYLHPQARNTLFRILKQAIKEAEDVEGQIVYTTHSENFVDCGDFDDVVIFTRTHDGIKVKRMNKEVLKRHTIALGQIESDICEQHIHYRLVETISQGLKEALFAHKAVIVEGPSEIELFRFFSDAEKEQIGIVSAGGKSNIPAIYSFLTAFGVPCLIVIDRDGETQRKNEQDNVKIAGILQQINAANPDNTKMDISEGEINNVKDDEIYSNGRLLVFGKNLDTILRKRVADWDKLLSLLRETFNLPSENPKPGPRDIQALGLVYTFECKDNIKLNEAIKISRQSLDDLGKRLNEFINQEAGSPNLLVPK